MYAGQRHVMAMPNRECHATRQKWNMMCLSLIVCFSGQTNVHNFPWLYILCSACHTSIVECQQQQGCTCLHLT